MKHLYSQLSRLAILLCLFAVPIGLYAQGCINVHLEKADYQGYLWQRHLDNTIPTDLYEMNWKRGDMSISLIFLANKNIDYNYTYTYADGSKGVRPGTYTIYSGRYWTENQSTFLGYCMEYIYNPYTGYSEYNEVYSAVSVGGNEYIIYSGTITVADSPNGPYITIEGHDSGSNTDICSSIGSLDNSTVRIPLTEDLSWQDNTGVSGWQAVIASGTGTGSDGLPYTATIVVNTSTPSGTFPYSKIDLGRTSLYQNGVIVPFTNATVTINASANVYSVTATFYGNDGRTYIVSATYSDCPEAQTLGSVCAFTYEYDQITSSLVQDPDDNWYYIDPDNKFIKVVAYNTDYNDQHNYVQLYFYVGGTYDGWTQTYTNGIIGPKAGDYRIVLPSMTSINFGIETGYFWYIKENQMPDGPVVVGNTTGYVPSYGDWRCPFSSWLSYRNPYTGVVTDYPSVTGFNTFTIHVQEGKDGQMFISIEKGGTIPITIGEPASAGGYKLTLTTSGEGTVTKEPDECWYAPGTQVTLTPEPATGWVFSDWTGTGNGHLTDNGDGTYTYTVPEQNASITANFIQRKEKKEDITLCSSELPYTWRRKYLINDPVAQNGLRDTVYKDGRIDSIITLKLTIHNAYPAPGYIRDERTLCGAEAEGFMWEGIDFSQYAHTSVPVDLDEKKVLRTIHDCDSAVNLILHIIPTDTLHWQKLTYCQSQLDEEEIYWFRRHITGPENLGDTLHMHLNPSDPCYTVLLLDSLEVYGDDHTYDTVRVSSYPFKWRGLITINSPEEVATKGTIRRQNIHECDSVITLVVIEERQEEAFICPNTSYNWEGHDKPWLQNLTQETIYRDTLTGVLSGSDSIYFELSLQVMPAPVTVQLPDTLVCSDWLWDSFQWEIWEGHTKAVEIGEETDYDLTEMRPSVLTGCDSVLYQQHLHIFTTFQEQIFIDTCGPSFEYTAPWGETRTISYPDDYVEMTQEIDGSDGMCESTVGINITWRQPEPYQVTDGITLCASKLDEFTWEGEHFTPDELTKTLTLPSVADCDSVVTFTVTLLPESDNIQDGATICSSALDGFTWEGEHFTTTDLVKTKTLRAVGGCDSVVTFTLTVSDAYRVNDGATICESELATFRWQGEAFTKSNLVKTKTLRSVGGCDSIVTFTLTLLPSYTRTDGATVCDTELPYRWQNGSTVIETFNDAGTRTRTLRTVNGCDSVVTFTLNVLRSTRSEKSLTINAKELPYTWDGITFTQARDVDTVMILTGANAAGCDSTVIRHLHVDICVDVKADVRLSAPTVCADAEAATATLSITNGDVVSYRLTYPAGMSGSTATVQLPQGTEHDIRIPLPVPAERTHYIRPDAYPVQITLTDICDREWTLAPVTLQVLYPSWLIVQKWDDVLALYNERYNGGYRFSRIRWFNDGAPVEGSGANNSYIYANQGHGEMLRFGTPYWAELTREDDGKTVCTCPFVPQRTQPAPERKGIDITFSQQGYQLLLSTELNGTYALYDITGKAMQTGCFGEQYSAMQIDINRSCAAGSYLIVFRADDGTTLTRKFALY